MAVAAAGSAQRSGKVGRKTPIELLGGQQAGALPIGLVVVRQYQAGARWQPRLLSAGQALPRVRGCAAEAGCSTPRDTAAGSVGFRQPGHYTCDLVLQRKVGMVSFSTNSHIHSRRIPMPSVIVPAPCLPPTCNLAPRDVESFVDALATYHAAFAEAFRRPEQVRWSAVYLHGLFGVRHPSFERHPHAPTTPASYHTCTTGVRSVSHASGITQCITGFQPNHADRESGCPERAFSTTGLPPTPCTTGTQHNGRASHPAPRAPARRRWHNERSRIATDSSKSKTGCRPRSPDAERPGVVPPAARDHIDKSGTPFSASCCQNCPDPAGRLQRHVRRISPY